MTTTLAGETHPGNYLFDHCNGVMVCDDLLDPAIIDALGQEAMARYPDAEYQATEIDDLADGRGGHPARSLWSVSAGPAQDRLYHSPELAQRLSLLTNHHITASGGRGTYSYYLDGGHLALHRDVVSCDISVITVLSDTAGDVTESGALVVYPDRNHEALSAIRRDQGGARLVKLQVGQTAILLGGLVAHKVLSNVAGAQRVISVMCFQIEPSRP